MAFYPDPEYPPEFKVLLTSGPRQVDRLKGLLVQRVSLVSSARRRSQHLDVKIPHQNVNLVGYFVLFTLWSDYNGQTDYITVHSSICRVC